MDDQQKPTQESEKVRLSEQENSKPVEKSGIIEHSAKEKRREKPSENVLPSKIELEFREELKQFYQDHFNLEYLMGLLQNHSFETREFGFIRRDDNRMYRNKSFKNRKYLVEYLKTFPVNHSYIGAIYEDRVMPTINYVPGTSIDQTKWLGRELTFDLDLTDYDTVRTCGCQGREFCSDCWKLMQEASAIIEETLREEFGFEYFVWIFSGGRGYHCWVLDDIAFELTEAQRKSIVGYFQLIYTTVNYEKIEDIHKLSIPQRDRIYQKLVRPFFMTADSKELEAIDGIGSKTVETAKERFQYTAIPSKIMEVIPKNSRNELLEKVIHEHYPRLDAAVTEGHNHLIRLPGSVHMGSGFLTQVVEDPQSFDPTKDAKHFYDFIDKDTADLHFDDDYQSTIFKIDDPNYARWKILKSFISGVPDKLLDESLEFQVSDDQVKEIYEELIHKFGDLGIEILQTDYYEEFLSLLKMGFNSDADENKDDEILEIDEKDELPKISEEFKDNLVYTFEISLFDLEITKFEGLARIDGFAETIVNQVFQYIRPEISEAKSLDEFDTSVNNEENLNR